MAKNDPVFLPKDSGKIVSMALFKDRIYIATENNVWYLNDKEERFIRCKFQQKEGVYGKE